MADALTAAAAVRARIAAAVLEGQAEAAAGAFVLRPSQRRTVALLRRAIAAHGGALLSDAPGTGKTVIALAVTAGYGDVLVAAPAAVRAQWLQSAERAGVALRFASLEALSHGLAPRAGSLLIVDEAHHLRNAGTHRYRQVASLARDAAVLLLSATPVVNRRADRDALLALFLSPRAMTRKDVLSDVLLRDATSAEQRAPLRLPDLPCAADIPGLADAISSLPPAFPTADGRSATALIALGLAMAWASSLAALDAALRRREQRGRALADSLAAGRWPTRDALRSWVLGDDSTQLALEIVVEPSQIQAPRDALPVLHRHLEAVSRMRGLIAGYIAQDSGARANALVALLDELAPLRVLVLAHHAETVRALHRQLRHLPGVVAITGTRVLAASGTWSRAEILTALGPGALPYRADDPLGIRLLIATDLLAEGVELQGCAALVHGDPTWTPARLEQREGRVLREGQRAQVRIAQFRLPAAAAPLLALRERLAAKRRARVTAAAPADAARALRTRLSKWLTIPRTPAADSLRLQLFPTERLAAVCSRQAGFLAVVRIAGELKLLGGLATGRRWRVTTDPAALLTLIELAGGVSARLERRHVQCVRRVLRRWLTQRAARRTLRGESALDDALARRLRRRLDTALAAEPLARRTELSAAWAQILQRALTARGVGHRRDVQRLLRDAPDDRAFIDGLAALTTRRPDSLAESGRLSLHTLLLLVGPSQAPSRPLGSAPFSRSAASRA